MTRGATIIKRIPLLFMAALVAMPLPAQMPPRAPSPGDIVVEGRGQEKPPQQIARDFTHTPPEEQIARWRTWLCIDILGIPDDRASYIRGRIAENAKGAGLKVISGKCTWNILIEFPSDADGATRQLIKDHPGTFRDLDRKGFPDAGDVRTLLASRPVRWLEVRRQLGAPIAEASHITVNLIGEKEAELVIVDPRRLGGVSWQQLADYLSMAALTEPRLGKSYETDDSILRLFSARDRGAVAPAGMTADDRTILHAFYASREDVPAFWQRSTVSDALAKAKATANAPKHAPQ